VGRLTFEGVLGIARTTIVDEGTQDFNCDMVTPAQIDIKSLPSNASDMPSSARITLTIFGFELIRQYFILRPFSGGPLTRPKRRQPPPQLGH